MKNILINSFYRVLFLFVFVCSASCIYAQYDWKPQYAGEIHAGYGTTTSVENIKLYCGRVMLGTTQGVAFGKYGDMGIGIDAVMMTHYYSGQGLRFAVNPYYEVRPAFPISENFAVFLDCALGAFIPVANMEGSKTEFTFQFGPGIRYKRTNIYFGMQSIGSGKGSITFFAKLGLSLGKK